MTSVHDGGSSFQGVGAIASQAWPKAYLLRRSVEYAFVEARATGRPGGAGGSPSHEGCNS